MNPSAELGAIKSVQHFRKYSLSKSGHCRQFTQYKPINWKAQNDQAYQ